VREGGSVVLDSGRNHPAVFRCGRRERQASLALAAGVLLLLAACARPGQGQPSIDVTSLTTPQPTADPNAPLVLGVGDIAQESGVQFAVTQVSAPYHPKDTAVRPRRGQFVVAAVDIHNYGLGAVDVAHQRDFSLLGPNGQAYADTTVPELPQPPNGAIQPGADVSGDVAFDVPAGQTYRLAFKSPAFARGELVVNLAA